MKSRRHNEIRSGPFKNSHEITTLKGTPVDRASAVQRNGGKINKM